MGNKSEDDAAGTIETLPGNRVVEAIRRTVNRIVTYVKLNRKKIAIWTTAAVAAGIALYVGVFWVYATMLFKSGDESLAKKEYPRAITDLVEYQKIAGKDEASSALLSRALLFAGEYKKLRDTFGDYHGEDLDIRYAHAIALYQNDPKEAGIQLKALADSAGEDLASMPHISRAQGVIGMLRKNYTSASRILKESFAAPENEEYLRALFSFFLANNKLSFSTSVPLPFKTLSETIPNFTHIINYRFYPDGYDNSFSIPMDANNLAHDMAAAPVEDVYHALSLLSDTLQRPQQAAEISRNFRSQRSGEKSLLAHYIMGYHHAAANDAAAAAEIYAVAAKLSQTSRAYQYQAAALWMLEKGAPPSPEVVKIYQQAIAANEKNVPALNNYAFLELYLGNFDKAKAANEKAAKISGTAPSVVINRILIGLADNTLDSEKALISADSLLGTNDKSALLVELAAQIRIRRQNMFGAAHFLQRLKDLRPDDASVPRRIADVHRHSGQMLLAANEIGDALQQFPNNPELLHDYVIYNAYIANSREVKNTLKKIDASARDFVAARANMILSYSVNPLEAIKFGELAIKAAPPAERTAVAVEVARLHLAADDPGRAEVLYKAAVANAKQSFFVGRDNILRALALRIKAADGDLASEEKITILIEHAAKSENISAQLDLCWALLSLDKINTAITFLEKIRALQVQPPETLMVALHAAYSKAGQTASATEIKARIAAARKNIEKITAGRIEVNLPEVKAIFAAGSNNFAKSLNRALEEKNYELVVALYTELIDSKKDIAQKPAKNFQNRGVIYILLERYEEAIADFAKALTMKEQLSAEESDSVHYNYVNVLVKAREFQRAVDEVQNRLDKPGEFKHEVQYLQLLGFSLSQIGRYREASDTYKTLIDIHPDNVNNYIKLAGVARVEENFPLAIKTLTEGLEVQPSNIEMREMLYRIYNSLGQVDDAKRQLEFIKKIKKK
ncbi:MAG: hypothetical protein HAW59_00085 [Betaproteobacteria bacterium]|nr:hypothetical protein [Betaproteobacteria bacterium]